jgi:hypothetical protein
MSGSCGLDVLSNAGDAAAVSSANAPSTGWSGDHGGHPSRQLRIEPHNPIFSDREIRGMQGLRFEENQYRSVYLRPSGSIMSNTKAAASSR